MSAPKRIQLRRTKGWRKPPDAITVARPTRWGNPYLIGAGATLTAHVDEFPIDITLTAELAVQLYRELMEIRLWIPPGAKGPDLEYSQEWAAALEQLRGHDLACWCPLDAPCHADVLLELANHPKEP